ncbi:unnamed protein product [Gongylonema pulchrum]|uniref:Tubulin_C domain-containing protein n=1 Tax=Gongylonema pulchrum TaxID=637853 RepID=A0A183DLE7_9BILA|nr:unnamed protein product [Gongylonema pulchrum]
MRPFPDQTSGSFMADLSLSDVNSEGIRQQIISSCKCRSYGVIANEVHFADLIPGTGEPGSTQAMAGTLNQHVPTDNMFTTSQDIDKKFEVFPEVHMKSEPIYKTAAEYER